MKTKGLLLFVTLICLQTFQIANAQKGIRIGYIDMDYILENVPDYNTASSELEVKVQKWKVEIEAQLKDVTLMREDLDNERVLLTKELIEEREEDILFKEKEILEYQQKRFGPNGDLFLQKKRLIQPVQDQVFVAVQEIAKNKKYDFIFDKSADMVMLYSATRFDISDQVLLRINRASKRKQLNSKKDKKAAEKDEDQIVEEEKNELSDKEKLNQEKKSERTKLLEQRRAQRDSLRISKKREFEEKKAKLLALQKRKKDSLNSLNTKKEEIKNPETVPSTKQ